jgi:hypothetical protein
MADAAAATLSGFSTEGFFEFVAAMVKDRRALIRRPMTVAFAVVGEGHFLITSANKEPLTREWKDDADLGIISNPKTLEDIMLGRFDLNAPGKGHLFLWGGDNEVLGILAKVFSSGQSMVDLRAGGAKSKKPKP